MAQMYHGYLYLTQQPRINYRCSQAFFFYSKTIILWSPLEFLGEFRRPHFPFKKGFITSSTGHQAPFKL